MKKLFMIIAATLFTTISIAAGATTWECASSKKCYVKRVEYNSESSTPYIMATINGDDAACSTIRFTSGVNNYDNARLKIVQSMLTTAMTTGRKLVFSYSSVSGSECVGYTVILR